MIIARILFLPENNRGTSIGEKIRNLLMDKNNKDMSRLPNYFYFAGARAQHIEELIIPSLNSGKSVVSDRFDTSTMALSVVWQEQNGIIKRFFSA